MDQQKDNIVDANSSGSYKYNVKGLVGLICSQLQLSSNFGHKNTGERVENHFLTHLGITRKIKNYKLLLQIFGMLMPKSCYVLVMTLEKEARNSF